MQQDMLHSSSCSCLALMDHIGGEKSTFVDQIVASCLRSSDIVHQCGVNSVVIRLDAVCIVVRDVWITGDLGTGIDAAIS
jgi:hypothetical protein